MANTNDKAIVVNEGATYEPKDGGQRVVAFHVDRPRSRVFFAPLGASTEDRMDLQEFLDTHKLVAQQGEPLPEAKRENEKAAKAANTRAPRQDTRTARIDTTTASPTRTDLEGRAAARNK